MKSAIKFAMIIGIVMLGASLASATNITACGQTLASYTTYSVPSC